jgi:hypothetical protein
MDKSLERALAHCLAEMEAGTPLEECLARYPQHARALRPMLETAQALMQAPEVRPSYTFRKHARSRLVARLAQRAPARRAAFLVSLRRWFAPPARVEAALPKARPRSSPLLRWAIIAALVVALASGTVAASAQALPGDPLYPLKLGAETLQVALAGPTENELRVILDLTQRRMGEITLLVQAQRYEDLLVAATQYERSVGEANERLRQLVIEQPSSAAALGSQVERTLFYNRILLNGLRNRVPEKVAGAVDYALGAATSGQSIASSWLRYAKPGVSGAPPETAATPIPSGSSFLPLPTTVQCWPADVDVEPPAGIPPCAADETPVPYPDVTEIVCWPADLPLKPPPGIPLCQPGELPVPVPSDLPCWPQDLPFYKPPGLPTCAPGQVPNNFPRIGPTPMVPRRPLLPPPNWPPEDQDSESFGGWRFPISFPTWEPPEADSSD